MIGSHLPDYVLSEEEDRARRRYMTPSNISPWHGGVSNSRFLTDAQCEELRRRGIDPTTTVWVEGANWMWVTVPIDTPVEFDNRVYGRAVQHIAAPIIRMIGGNSEVLTPRGRPRTVYANGKLSDPNKKRSFRGMMGRG